MCRLWCKSLVCVCVCICCFSLKKAPGCQQPCSDLRRMFGEVFRKTVFEIQKIPCGFCSGSLCADCQQEVKSNRCSGWHKLSDYTDVHHYSAAARADNLFHKWAAIANARIAPRCWPTECLPELSMIWNECSERDLLQFTPHKHKNCGGRLPAIHKKKVQSYA